MKLQQLQYLAAVMQNDLNVSAAAKRLRTSQPAVSKQIRQLEEELGVRVFVRAGRQFTGVTPMGHQVFDRAQSILRESRYISAIAQELRGEDTGTLSIGTTHTQARYVLPQIIRRFTASYPKIRLHLHQGTVEQIADMVQSDQIDFAMATGSKDLFGGWVLLPCYRWHRCVVVPQEHPLTRAGRLSLPELARHPLITYAFSLAGPAALQTVFADAGLSVQIALTAWDADVIKTYVRHGLGVGIVAQMALDPCEDADLVCIDVSHLLAAHTTWIGFSRGTLLRRCMYQFLQLCAPHLHRQAVIEAEICHSQAQVDALFAGVPLPLQTAGGQTAQNPAAPLRPAEPVPAAAPGPP
jgi:LysR family cys regulon transcriptional activator